MIYIYNLVSALPYSLLMLITYIFVGCGDQKKIAECSVVET